MLADASFPRSYDPIWASGWGLNGEKSNVGAMEWEVDNSD